MPQPLLAKLGGGKTVNLGYVSHAYFSTQFNERYLRVEMQRRAGDYGFEEVLVPTRLMTEEAKQLFGTDPEARNG